MKNVITRWHGCHFRSCDEESHNFLLVINDVDEGLRFQQSCRLRIVVMESLVSRFTNYLLHGNGKVFKFGVIGGLRSVELPASSIQYGWEHMT